jgi:hypothetical protein
MEATVTSFERDVRPLFRERDRGAMLGVADFDLWKREDVAEFARHPQALGGWLDAVRPGLARGAGSGLPPLGRRGNARVTVERALLAPAGGSGQRTDDRAGKE